MRKRLKRPERKDETRCRVRGILQRKRLCKKDEVRLEDKED